MITGLAVLSLLVLLLLSRHKGKWIWQSIVLAYFALAAYHLVGK